MNRRTVVSVASGFLAMCLLTVACGSAGTSPAASAGASQPAGAPSVALPSVALPSVVLPSVVLPSGLLPSGSFAIPSFSFAIPSFSFPSEDKDLEARLPSQVNGVTLTKSSYKGSTFLGSGNPSAKDLVDLLTVLGKSPNDLSVAYAQDASGTLDVSIGAFRVAGADANALLAAFTVATKKDTPDAQITSANVGGKNVTQVVDPANPDQGTVYAYGNGDTLFYVQSADPALAATTLQAMP